MRNIAVIGCGYWGKNLVRNFLTWRVSNIYSIGGDNRFVKF